MTKFIKYCAVMCAYAYMAFSVQAATVPNQISPQQIEQFRKLPQSQQRALAKSMGLDFNAIQTQLNETQKRGEGQDKILQPVYPRGTKFDEFGNPIIEDSFAEELEEEEEQEPKPFGYDVFANAPATFAPSVDVAIPDDYTIGPGDVLSIQIFGKENAEYQFPVSREGNIVLPNLGPFSVSGLTFAETKAFLKSEVKNKVLGVDVVITLAELRSMRIFVLGDAYKPGPYVLSSLSSITHALFAAGGINDIGSLRNIQLKRAGKLVTTLDLYDLLIKGDSSNDLTLKSGDVVFVAPVGERVTVSGEVRRPAIYELSENETFKSVIKMAGGMLPAAFPSSTVVERFNDKNLRTVMSIDLSSNDSLNKKVKAGDFIRVMPTSEQYEESITIIGAVTRPGKYQWQKGQRISDLLPNVHAYLLDDADLTYGLVVREKDIGRNIAVLQFGLFNALSDLDSDDNLLLQPHDKILIFSSMEKKELKDASLEQLALTKEELLKKEKQLIKDKYKDRLFWQEYGEEGDTNKYKEVDEADEALKLASQSLEELMGGSLEEEIDIRDLGLFSRKRLLAPVIQKLRRQASVGQPIQLFEVVGSVKYPGVYPLAVNNKVSHAVVAAGGLLESAFLGKAEITRDDIVQGKAIKSSLNVNLELALKGVGENNIALKSKDRLNVHQTPAWQENHIVELRGEFMFPGKYTIRRGETLAELIERAGGYTEFAYLEASVFTREKLKQLEMQNLLKVAESLRMEIASKSLAQSKGSQMVDYSQAKLLLADLTKVKPIGRLVVDLPKLTVESDFDVLLENGDILYVPTKQNSVNVIGQVQVATSHMYQRSLSAFDYVTLSGGVKQQADDDRIYVIKANGSVEIPSQGSNWFASTNNEGLSPGDTVVVPLDSDYMDNLTLWATGTQIIYQAAVAIAAISGI